MSGTDYTLTPNLGLYKPTVNADGDAWGGHWNQNADKLDVVAAGGPFLPLSGGTVTGPTGFTNVSYNMLASGAAGDGVTDDTAKIQTFLNTLPVGVEVVLPATKQFLIDSADLTIPAGVTICGQGAFTETSAGIGNLVGPAFVLNPNRSLLISNAVRLSNFKVLRKGLLASPSSAQINAAIAAWAAEAPLYKTSASTASGNTLPFTNTAGVTVGMKAFGQNLAVGGTTVTAIVANTSVTFGAVINFPVPAGAYVRFGNSIAVRILPNTGGVNLDRLFILGLNTAILTETGRFYIDTIEADCTTILSVIHGADASYVSRVHCIPYYGATSGAGAMRPGPAFLFQQADGYCFDTCTSVSWALGFVLFGTGGTVFRRCWAETFGDGATVTTGWRTESASLNVVTFAQCCASGMSVGFDFQHQGGAILALGCNSAPAGDGTQVAHYRLGAQSSGEIASAMVNSAGTMPFVVQAGVGQWHVITPLLYGAGGTWITGAPADLANVWFVGGPLGAAFPTTFNGPVTCAGALTVNGAATLAGGINGVTVANNIFQVGSGGNAIRLTPQAAGTPPVLATLGADTNINLLVSCQGTGGVQFLSRVGFNSAAPIAKPTVTGAKAGNAALASLLTALAGYGLVLDSST